MSKVWCHLCGKMLADGTLKYEVAVRVRSMFDGTIPPSTYDNSGQELSDLMGMTAQQSKEELDRQIYEDDVFIMCPACKETFLQYIYSHLRPEATPEHGRAHLLH